jgi:hypothetical protein
MIDSAISADVLLPRRPVQGVKRKLGKLEVHPQPISALRAVAALADGADVESLGVQRVDQREDMPKE